MRKCPFHGCVRTIDPGRFACRGHWFSFTPAERREIWKAFEAYRADRIDVAELRAIQARILGNRGEA